jgi:hypothetical protein
MRGRMLGLGICFLFLVGCTSSSEGQRSEAKTSLFLGHGEPELFDTTDSFGVGCPDGWSYQEASGFGVPGFRFRPAEALPGGIDSAIFAVGGSRIELDVQVPDDPERLLEQLTRLFDAEVNEQSVGKWDDRDALWFRGRVQDDFLSTEEKVDGFVAAVKDAAGEWRGYLIDSYPQGVYEAALSEVVAGFQPGGLQATPSIDPSMKPMSGTCEGVFSSVSPPPVQRIEAIIVTFDTLPIVQVTNRVSCTDPTPGPKGCYLLPALDATSAEGARSLRLSISSTATNAEVRELMQRLEDAPHIKSFRVVKRQA